MFFEHDGARMYYEVHGERAGTPLLLLHGWGGSCASWGPMAGDFQGQRTVYAVDFPGHGQSADPPEPWSVTEYMALIDAFLRDREIARVDVVAHSFGGRVALLLAAERPERVNTLILTGCAGLLPKKATRRGVRLFAYRTLRSALSCPLARAIWGEEGVAARRERLIQRFGSEDYKALSPSMRRTFNRVIAQDLGDCLPRIKAPTLLFWGELDADTPLWMGERMAREIPDAGLVVMTGCGHFAYLERYVDFRAAVRSFLAA